MSDRQQGMEQHPHGTRFVDDEGRCLACCREVYTAELDRLRRELAEMTAAKSLVKAALRDEILAHTKTKADARALARECEAARAKDSGPSGCVAFTGNTGLCEHCDLESDLNHARKATDDRNAMRWAKQQPTP